MTTLEEEYDAFSVTIASLKANVAKMEHLLDEWERRDALPWWRRLFTN